MQIEISQVLEILHRTPGTLRALLDNLPDGWLRSNEGGDSWSAYGVLGHLIHGERTDWLNRVRMIVEHGEDETFEPFDRLGMLKTDQSLPIGRLVDEFTQLRAENLGLLRCMRLLPTDLERAGRHPEFGRVTLGQLLATWVAHDLGHIAQISRVMAKQYSDQVGPWSAYLPILSDRSA